MISEKKRGMEGCLVLLEYHKRRFQRRYDRELTNRLRKRLATTIAICEKLGDYRRAVLRCLIEHPAAKTSSLAKAFSAAFDGLEVTSSVLSEPLYLKYNAISEADISSNSSGSGNEDANDQDTHASLDDVKPKLRPSPFDGHCPERQLSDDDMDDMFQRPPESKGSILVSC